MKKLIIIPSREASTRLPGKPLAKFGGKTLVRHVWEKASAVPNADVCVATDSEKIRDEVFQFGGRVEMTDPNIPTGTDRVIAAFDKIGDKSYDCVINLQGDMPFITPEQVIKSTLPLNHNFEIGCLVYEMVQAEQNNPNSVKAIVSMGEGNLGRCHWFLRAPLKYGYHHAGIYSFTIPALEKIRKFRQTKFENFEKLEQLRFLENGITMGAMLTTAIDGEINTPEDLDKARRIYGN